MIDNCAMLESNYNSFLKELRIETCLRCGAVAIKGYH